MDETISLSLSLLLEGSRCTPILAHEGQRLDGHLTAVWRSAGPGGGAGSLGTKTLNSW